MPTRLCLLPFWQHEELPSNFQGLGGAFLYALAVELNKVQDIELVGSQQPGKTARLLEAAKTKADLLSTLSYTAQKAMATTVIGGSLEMTGNIIQAHVFLFKAQNGEISEYHWPNIVESFFIAIKDTLHDLGQILQLELPPFDKSSTSSVESYLHFFRALTECSPTTRSPWPKSDFWQHLLRAIAYDPGFREAVDLIVLRALPLLKTRMACEAEIILRQLLKLVPTNAGVHFALAEFSLARGDFNSAIKYIKDALKHQPDFVEGYVKLSLLYHNMGDMNSALKTLEGCVNHHSERANFHDLRGVILAQNGCLDDAVLSWQKALSLDPSRAGILSNLGLIMENRDPRLASAYYEGGLAIAPNWWGTYQNYGSFLLRQGDLGGAQRLLSRAVQLNRSNALCQLRYGQVQMELGEFDLAEEALIKALQLAGDPAIRDKALVQLERLDDYGIQQERWIGRKARKGSSPQAFLGTILLLSHQANNWRAWLAAGRGWEERQWGILALVAYRKAHRLDPSQAATAKAFGLLLAARGRKDAKNLLQIAQACWPGDLEIQRALRH